MAGCLHTGQQPTFLELVAIAATPVKTERVRRVPQGAGTNFAGNPWFSEDC